MIKVKVASGRLLDPNWWGDATDELLPKAHFFDPAVHCFSERGGVADREMKAVHPVLH